MIKLDKYQIMNLMLDEDDTKSQDLASYAESHFGPMIFDEGFDRFTNEEVQDWYYREYIPDRETDIAEGFDRGQ